MVTAGYGSPLHPHRCRASVATSTAAARPTTRPRAFAPDVTPTATAYQLAVTLFETGAASPALHRLSLALSRAVPDAPGPASASAAWGRDVPVPARSDMLAHYRGSAYGGGGDVWCSPASTSMILAYWAQVLGRADLDESVPQAAGATYDW